MRRISISCIIKKLYHEKFNMSGSLALASLGRLNFGGNSCFLTIQFLAKQTAGRAVLRQLNLDFMYAKGRKVTGSFTDAVIGFFN
jgi:hypothetical protein